MTETHPQKRLGYARVSTYGHTFDAQLEQLREAGCTKIYREKVTGAHSDRRELLKMLHALAPGDVVTVTRIDSLARSTFDLFAIVKQIVDAKAQFRSLAEPWADTGTHVLPALPRPAAVLGGAGADKIALHVGEASENGGHQAPGAGAGVGPRLGERAKLRLGVHDLLDDGEQVEGAAREAVDPRHRHHVAGGEGV